MTKVFGNVIQLYTSGRCFIDWATAVAGEDDIELTCVTFTYHGSGPDMSNTTFYPNTNTQYFQRGLNNAQYQYFERPLTIPIPKSLKHPNITQYQYQYLNDFVVFVPLISSTPKVY